MGLIKRFDDPRAWSKLRLKYGRPHGRTESPRKGPVLSDGKKPSGETRTPASSSRKRRLASAEKLGHRDPAEGRTPPQGVLTLVPPVHPNPPLEQLRTPAQRRRMKQRFRQLRLALEKLPGPG